MVDKKGKFNFIEWKVGESRALVFKGMYKSVGIFKKRVYCFVEGKKLVHIWECLALNSGFFWFAFWWGGKKNAIFFFF